MNIVEFSDDLKQFIRLGEERVNVEYKGRLTWGQGVTNLTILRAMMAMANSRDGGVIIIGVEDGSFDPVGLMQAEFESYEYDRIGRYINTRTQPAIDFDLKKGKITEEDGSERLFIVIQVQEADDFPVVSTSQELKNRSAGAFGDNVVIRNGVVYIRSKSPVESREIHGHREWKDFVKLLLDRNQRKLIEMIPWSAVESLNMTEETDIEKFNQQLGGL